MEFRNYNNKIAICNTLFDVAISKIFTVSYLYNLKQRTYQKLNF